MKLTEADELLRRYRSERRVIGFQMNKLQLAIKELRKVRTALEKTETQKAKSEIGVLKRGPGRPRKSEDGVVKRGPGRPRKVVDGEAPVRKRKGRPGRKRKAPGEGPKLNKWDEAVISVITKTDRLMPKEKLLVEVNAWAKKNEPKMKAPEVEAYLTRSLQKLSTGKVKSLGTYRSGLRRGHHYGLAPWFYNSTGKLRATALEKLDLTEEVAG